MKENTIGMDLGDHCHAVCVLDKAGNVVEERTVINDRESIGEWFNHYKGATVAMETSNVLSKQLRPIDSMNRCVNP